MAGWAKLLTDLQEPEFARVPQVRKNITLHRVEGSLIPRLVDPKREVCPKSQKETHRDDLPDQTCNHNVRSCERARVCPSSRRQAATGTLKGECEHIAANEDVRVELWGDPRVLATVDCDDALETEVDGGCEKGGSDSKADKIEVLRPLL